MCIPKIEKIPYVTPGLYQRSYYYLFLAVPLLYMFALNYRG